MTRERKTARLPITSILENVSETSLLPLWARAMESLKPNALFRDEPALSLYKSLDYDFSKFKDANTSQIAIAIRTVLIDQETRNYLDQYPDGTVINLGAGLDSRFQRMDNGRVHWYDIDLAEIIGLRKQLFPKNERCQQVASSALNEEWAEHIVRSEAPPLIIAEGLLMYFTEPQAKALFGILTKHFTGAKVVIEMIPEGALGNMKFHEGLNWMNASFRWTIDQIADLRKWYPQLHVRKEQCLLDFYWQRWGWLSLFSINPLFRWFFGERIAVLEIEGNANNVF